MDGGGAGDAPVPVARIYGLDIYLLDELPIDGDTHSAMLVGAGAFAAFVANQPSIEKIPHAGSTITTYDAVFRYATTMYRTAPRRVVLINSQEPDAS